MPKHYAIGENIFIKTGKFKNVKTAIVPYGKTLDKKPMISITPTDAGLMPLFKADIQNDKVVIRCKTKSAVGFDIIIIERS